MDLKKILQSFYLVLFHFQVCGLMVTSMDTSGLYKKVYLPDFGLSHTSFKVHLCKSMHEIFFFFLFLSMPLLDLESSHWLSNAAVTEVNFNLQLHFNIGFSYLSCTMKIW